MGESAAVALESVAGLHLQRRDCIRIGGGIASAVAGLRRSRRGRFASVATVAELHCWRWDSIGIVGG